MTESTAPRTGLNRRVFLKSLAAAGASLSANVSSSGNESVLEATVPARAITRGPQSHWFAYYDKIQFDPTDRYVLGMEVGFDFRAPEPEDKIRLGMVDLGDNDKWIDLGETNAWCWQQGCMLQWLPGSQREVIYNDRQDGRFVSVIRNMDSGQSRVISKPIYTVSPDGKTGICPSFARLNDTRPGYGYCGIPDPFADQGAPTDDGIYRVDLENGTSELIISLEQITRIRPNDTMVGEKHWFNHLLFSPDGSRFIFLHRWTKGEGGRFTRMFTARPDGSEIHCVADHEMVSHFIWKNPKQILAWSREPESGDHFHLYDDGTENCVVVGDGILKVDGHCTYSPDKTWILTDSYPGKDNMHNLMLFRPLDSKLVNLGKFFQPPQVRGKRTRCDLHPRWSRNGNSICIDSLCSGQRQLYLLEVGEIVGA